MSSNATDPVFAAQLEELFRRTRVSSMLALPPIVLLAGLHIGHVATFQVLMWALALVAVYVVRILLAQSFLERPPDGEPSPLWLDVGAIAAAASGAGWGASLFMMNTGQLDFLFAIKLAVLAAAVAFAMNSMAAVLFVYLSFAFPAFAIALGYLAMEAPFLPESGRIGLALSVLLYLVLLLALSRSVSTTMRRALQQRFEHGATRAQLEQALENERALRAQIEQQALQMQTTHMRLHEFATHDPLTRLYNRKRLSETLIRELHLRHRYGVEVSVLIVDIDRFDQINERHGHATGDDVLIAFATMLAGELREIDYVGRLVANKFCCILPRTNAVEAIECAERLRRGIERFVPGALVALVEAAPALTVSIGAACAEDADDPERLLARADAALHEAKRNGRNRCRLKSDLETPSPDTPPPALPAR